MENNIKTPTHYESAIQPVDYIAANDLDFFEGNVLKYLHRHRKKNKDEDIKKLIHYACLILKYHYEYDDNRIRSIFE